jgi:AraC-like DNA-binding protein
MSHAAASLTSPSDGPLRVRARGAAVQTLYEQGATWVSFRPMPDLTCGIDFSIRKFPDLGLLSGTAQGVRHEHTHDETGVADDHFSFHLNISGLSIVAGKGREIALRDGDGVLLSSSQSRTITRAGPVLHRVVRLPRAILAPLVRNVDDAVLRPIRRGTGALNLLTSYVGALIDDTAISAPQMRRLIVAQLCDLVGVTLGAAPDAATSAKNGGIRAARLHVIKSDIEAHIADAGLSPAAVARRQGISESYIRKLFDGEGTTFSEFVLLRRLFRAYRMLGHPRWAECSIASIAFQAGFGDLSYFNRTFKRRYAARPSEIRGQ